MTATQKPPHKSKPKSTRTPDRKTTDATINPEYWRPIVRWVQDHRPSQSESGHKEYDLTGLFVDEESARAIQMMLRRSRRTSQNQDMRIRLPNAEMDALHEQFRFWETCIDELKKESRESAPPWRVFQGAAFEIEGAQIEATIQRRQPRRSTPFCVVCDQPIGQEGKASVDIDTCGRTLTFFTHLDC